MAGKPWSAERRAQHEAKMAQRKAAQPAAPKPKRSRKDPNAEAIEQLYGVGSVILMTMGRLNDAFLADALTLQLQAEETGAAFAEVAKINPRVADMLAGAAPATPYVLLGTVVFGTALQIAANHGAKLGPLASQTVPKETMVVEMKARMTQAAQFAETQRAQAEAELEDMRREQEREAEAARQAETAEDFHRGTQAAKHVIEDGWDPILAREAAL